ncbi:MAG: hypothetical protein ABI904_12810 [Chloroflexota bacterium]
MSTKKRNMLEHIDTLGDIEILNIADFVKMLELCQALKLPAANIPSVDEWNTASPTIKQIIAIAAYRLDIANGAYMSLLHSWAKQKEELSAKPNPQQRKQNKKAASLKAA